MREEAAVLEGKKLDSGVDVTDIEKESLLEMDYETSSEKDAV
jgi:hypothetical protein